jgi:uncharacterized protein (TIGR02594 family)
MTRKLKNALLLGTLLAAGSVGFVMSGTSAEARPNHTVRNSMHAESSTRSARRHANSRERHYDRHRVARRDRSQRNQVAAVQSQTATWSNDGGWSMSGPQQVAGSSEQVGNRQRVSMRNRKTAAATTVPVGTVSGTGLSAVVDEARRFIGASARQLGLPSSLWCADFMNYALKHAGMHGTDSRMASSFASYGQRVSGPQVGAIAVLSRGKRAGHVGVVSGVDAKGNPIIISGNHGNRVAEAAYSRSRVYAYVMPQ